jgi:O-antigen ligase
VKTTGGFWKRWGGAIVAAVLVAAFDPLASAQDSKRVTVLLLALALSVFALVRLARGKEVVSGTWRELRFSARDPLVWFVGLVVLRGLDESVRSGLTVPLVSSPMIAALVIASVHRRPVARLRSITYRTAFAIICSLAFAAGFARAFGRAWYLPAGNPDWFGLVIAPAWVLSVGYTYIAFRALRANRCASNPSMARRRGVLRLAFVVLVQIFALCLLVLSQSRAAWVAVVVAALVAVLVGCIRALSRRRPNSLSQASTGRLPRMVVAACVVCVTGALVWYATRATLAADMRNARTSRQVESWASVNFHDRPVSIALSGRVHIWKMAWHATSEAPLLGAGTGRFQHAFLPAQGEWLSQQKVQDAARLFVNAEHGHNDYVHLLTENGALGFCLLVMTFVCMLRASLRSREGVVLCATLTLVTQGLGDAPLLLPASMPLFGLLLASTSPRSLAVAKRPSKNKQSGLYPALAFAVACLLLCGLLLPKAALSLLMRRSLVVSHLASNDLTLRRRAQKRLPADGELQFLYGLSLYEDAQWETSILHLTASKRTFANVGTPIAIGNAQARLGKWQEAKAAFLEATALNPGSFRAHLNLAEACRQLEDRKCAEEELQRARKILPYHPRARELELRLFSDAANKDDLVGKDSEDEEIMDLANPTKNAP